MSRQQLRSYQEHALAALWKAYDGGANRLLLQMATGLGKTTVFASIPQWPAFAEWLSTFPERQRKILIIAHREELIAQAAARIHNINPDLQIGIEQGDCHAGPFSDVIIASVQTLSAMKYRRLNRLISYGAIRVVIVDEAHHAAATTYRNCLVRLGFLPVAEMGDDDKDDFPDVAELAETLREWETTAPKDRLLVGVTATPNRSDAVGLGCVFQTIAYTYPIRRAIEDQWLAPITPWVVDTKTSLDDVRITAGEFNQRDLAQAVNTTERTAIAIAAWNQYGAGRKTLAFTVDVQHAHDVAAAFRQAGIGAAVVSGETPKEERRMLLAKYQQPGSSIQVLANCMVLTEGTDLPATSCILHMKPTKSATLYEQMTGRGLRLFDGKKDCVIIDVVDIARRHSLQTAPMLYGLPPLKPQGKNLTAMADELEALQGLYPSLNVEELVQQRGSLSLDELRAIAKSFDVWSVPELGMAGDGLSLNWIKVGDGVYRIQYPWADGREVVKVEGNMLGRFDVSCTLRPDGSMSVRQQTVVAGVEGVNAALVQAEAFITRYRGLVAKLKDKSAPWRRKPASQKQVALLRRRGIPFRPNVTMGEASDAIDLSNARSGR